MHNNTPHTNFKHKSTCHICTQRLLNYRDYLKCSICENYSHSKCNRIAKTESIHIIDNNILHNKWICITCTQSSSLSVPTTPDLNISSSCSSCLKPLGKHFSVCTFCDNNVHTRCNKLQLGCNTCNADIFPQETNIFFDSDSINNLIFNPYDPDHPSNIIGDFEHISSNSDLLHSLSQNLKNCKYTDLGKLKQKNDELCLLSLNGMAPFPPIAISVSVSPFRVSSFVPALVVNCPLHLDIIQLQVYLSLVPWAPSRTNT